MEEDTLFSLLLVCRKAGEGSNTDYFMNHTFSFVIQHPLFNLHTS